MTNGIIMCGNTTRSRNGTMGRVSITSALPYARRPKTWRKRGEAGRAPRDSPVRLSDLLDQGDRLLPVQHDVPGDDTLLDLLHRGKVVHQVEHQVFDDHPEAPRADLPLDGEIGDRLQS